VAAATSGFLGIDPRRKLPQWRRDTFMKWAKRWQARRKSGRSPVVLFADTFTNHYEAEIGIAAVDVLERGGVSPKILRPGCCARPMISKGLLEDARQELEKTVAALHPFAQRGEKILFLEPSCLSSLKEDAPSLLRGEAQKQARDVSKAVFLFEEYAATLDLQLKSGPNRILLHGHCHQKSMGLLDATKTLLTRVPGASVVDLDAGCCGMAGSFGYSAEHYDVSIAIANRKLLPAVKSMQSGDILVAPGTSCRHQVADLTGARALHPAELLKKLLK